MGIEKIYYLLHCKQNIKLNIYYYDNISSRKAVNAIQCTHSFIYVGLYSRCQPIYEGYTRLISFPLIVVRFVAYKSFVKFCFFSMHDKCTGNQYLRIQLDRTIQISLWVIYIDTWTNTWTNTRMHDVYNILGCRDRNV